MKDSDGRYLVDVLLFVSLAGLAFIGVLLGLVISEGPASSGASKVFLGLHRHQWGNLHASLSIAFLILLAVHLVLSWKWIKAKTRQIFKRGAAPALIAIGVLPFAALLLFWALTPKDAVEYRSYGVGAGENRWILRAQPAETTPPPKESLRQDDLRNAGKPAAPAGEPEDPRDEDHHAQVGSITVSGQQTLRNLSNATGIPAPTIARGLGLPEAVPMDETLGRLRRRYGFEIEDVRDLIARLLKEKESGGA